MPPNLTRFERIEKKYPLDRGAMVALERILEGRLEPDPWGASTVSNVYYDTCDLALARRSLAKPPYKEKLRVRSYGPTGPDDTVFVELKKKWRGVVYKRRIAATEARAALWLSGGPAPPLEGRADAQVAAEVERFMADCPVRPAMVVAYERHSLVDPGDGGLRVTFDENLRWRRDRLRLSAGSHGEALLDGDRVLMEVKVCGAMPLWLSRALGEVGARPSSFSKYGACCRELAARDRSVLVRPSAAGHRHLTEEEPCPIF
ncbi:polyphosphate polymerase domain-containing protein [Caniella muris]|uniref:polyphosphate polymerase domain-containing protein n=1 Tax=Caniella muris TaxID=2941502 RepID=UPI00203FDBAB|nr:polyphosphate polymerase domain-containing protein [Caniella muris]